MAGGLMQLVAYGSQDLYLTGNPQITFFKSIYRRYTNFSMEYIPQYFRVLPTFSTTQVNTLTVKIDRNADLIHDCYVVVDLPSIYSTEDERFQWIENVGQNIIQSAEITVNGVQLDIQYSQWMNVWAQLTIDRSKRRSYDEITGNIWQMQFPEKYYGDYSTTTKPTIAGRRLYVPLFFWFCTNPGLSIPLIALQYTDIYINIQFAPLNTLFTMWYGLSPETLYDFGKFGNTPTAGIPNFDSELLQAIQEAQTPPLVNTTAADLVNSLEAQGYGPTNYFWKFVNGTQAPNGVWTQNSYLFVNYIYLDEDERRRFAQTSHEYLMTQVQTYEFGGIDGNQTIELKMSQPVKELIFTTQRTDVNIVNQWNNYTNCLYNHSLYDVSFVKNANYFRMERMLIDNGIDSCLPDAQQQFNNNQQYNIDNQNILYSAKLILNSNDRFDLRDSIFFNSMEPYKYHTNSPDEGIYVYNFGLNPEDFQPSGTCNFSRINRAQLQMNMRQVVNTDIEYNVIVYARNINVFRIMAGIGNVVFAN
jgi:hypothetical protein